ncbi:ROK family protein [Oscillospiraceae bacterium PP1C4]
MKYYLGIDLGGTNIAVGIIDENYKFVAEHETPTLGCRPFEIIVADMADAAKKALENAGLTTKDIEHVGIGAPSTVDPTTRHLVFANNLNWVDVDVIGEFKKHMDVPVYLANDADCAAYGEALAGAAKDYTNVMMLTLGTGVGGGIILDKKIFLGGNGHGSEPGHSTLVMDGEPCTCGRRGCLEAYASVTALIRDTIRAMAADPTSVMHEMCGDDMRKVNGRTAFDAAKKGDKTGLEVVENYRHYLAVGISSFITLFRPEVIILGGGVCNEGEYLLEPLRKEVNATAYAADLMPETPIIKAALGNNAGIIGAAFLGAQFK